MRPDASGRVGKSADLPLTFRPSPLCLSFFRQLAGGGGRGGAAPGLLPDSEAPAVAGGAEGPAWGRADRVTWPPSSSRM